jgi:hypothetical protein
MLLLCPGQRGFEMANMKKHAINGIAALGVSAAAAGGGAPDDATLVVWMAGKPDEGVCLLGGISRCY